jgi:26S proteasome regulatory subunit N5
MIKKLDYTRLFIISKKIESKNLQDEKIHDLKILYYSYLIFYYLHEGKYVEVADSYGKILETLHKVMNILTIE